MNKSLVNPKSTSNQSSKPCTVLQYPSRKESDAAALVKKEDLESCKSTSTKPSVLTWNLILDVLSSRRAEVVREEVVKKDVVSVLKEISMPSSSSGLEETADWDSSEEEEEEAETVECEGGEEEEKEEEAESAG